MAFFGTPRRRSQNEPPRSGLRTRFGLRLRPTSHRHSTNSERYESSARSSRQSAPDAAHKWPAPQNAADGTKSAQAAPALRISLSAVQMTGSVDDTLADAHAAPLPCQYVASATKLGSGAYGAVLLGTDVRTSAPVAIKFIADGRMRTSSLEREVGILRRLSETNHPALLKFHARLRPEAVRAGAVRAAAGAEGELPLKAPLPQCHALVMEVARGCELYEYVVKKEVLSERESAPLCAQLCDAVAAAHRLGVAHRDLKLENVLLLGRQGASAEYFDIDAVGSGSTSQQRIKLIDWGLAHQHALTAEGEVVPEMLHSRCGSRSYMAPEVANRDVSGIVGYNGFLADVWSLGVALFAMHLGFFPFEEANPEKDWRARRVCDAQREGRSTMATILGFYPARSCSLSAPLLALIDRMLIFEPSRRAGLTEVLCSEWLAPHVGACCPMALDLAASLALRASRTAESTLSGSSLSGHHSSSSSTRTASSRSRSRSSSHSRTPSDGAAAAAAAVREMAARGEELAARQQRLAARPPPTPPRRHSLERHSLDDSPACPPSTPPSPVAGDVDAYAPAPPPAPARLASAEVQVVVAGGHRQRRLPPTAPAGKAAAPPPPSHLRSAAGLVSPKKAQRSSEQPTSPRQEAQLAELLDQCTMERPASPRRAHRKPAPVHTRMPAPAAMQARLAQSRVM